MFKRREMSPFEQETETEPILNERPEPPVVSEVKQQKPHSIQKPNTIVKGSKLTGDIIISYDLELDGEVEGNITSEEKSNIIIKGNCNGNIKTKDGSVDIKGSMVNGDIISGGDLRITGKFNGGKAESKGKVYVDGEFSGLLHGNEVEIGPNAAGKGELFYKEFISIARGAKVDVKINRQEAAQKDKKKETESKVINMELPVQEKKQVTNSPMQEKKQEATAPKI
jgi:cytoskeletal protein CcmA (bactofilin family)